MTVLTCTSNNLHFTRSPYFRHNLLKFHLWCHNIIKSEKGRIIDDLEKKNFSKIFEFLCIHITGTILFVGDKKVFKKIKFTLGETSIDLIILISHFV